MLAIQQIDALRKASTPPAVRLWYAVLFLAIQDCGERPSSRKAQSAVVFILELLSSRDGHLLFCILPSTEPARASIARFAVACYLGVGRVRYRYLSMKVADGLLRGSGRIVHDVLGIFVGSGVFPACERLIRKVLMRERAVSHVYRERGTGAVIAYRVNREKLWSVLLGGLL